MTQHFPADVESELDCARDEHRQFASMHEAYSVILEELEEFWEEVRKKSRDRDNVKMYKELVRIGAMSQRAAEDCIPCGIFYKT